MPTMKYFWIFCCFSLLFSTQLSDSTYIFTQYKKSTSVCSSDSCGEYCQQRTPEIFLGIDKNYVMTLGFLNAQSDKFHDDYDMAEYGFPIFYEYRRNISKLKVNLIIANGKKEENGTALYYYVSLDEDKCNKTSLRNTEYALYGALYMNQKYAKYAYFIYQSDFSTTCILSIKFEDLFQGDYKNKNLVPIKAEKTHVIGSNVAGYVHPFFTIDPIFGTMVYLTRNGSELSVVHYKIDEKNLTNFEKVFSFPLKNDGNSFESSHLFDRFNDTFHMYVNEMNLSPSFASYGKTTFLFCARLSRESPGVVGFWSPKKTFEKNITDLHEDDRQRHMYYLDSEYYEKRETVVVSTKSSDAECSESLYFWLTVAVGAIDFILMVGLIGLGIMACMGSKKMKKLRRSKIAPRGKQRSTKARTNLNAQSTVKPTTYENADKVTVASLTPKGTTAGKTTAFKTL